MFKKVTAFTIHETAEGTRATFTYSIIDESGNLVKSNVRNTIILLDEEQITHAKELRAFLMTKIAD